jgi:hypothetical protein
MRLLGVIAVCLLAACADRPTLEELEKEALVTGDWSAVEEREREIMRRKGQTGLDCPNGAMAICYDYMSEERCMCVQPTAAGGGSGAEKLGVPN